MENRAQEKSLITKDSPLSEILERYPNTAVILTGYGLHCVGCHFSQFDTLKSAIEIHGMDQETFDLMLKDLNIIAKESKNN
jgi:hybrid cluster-associated redox disulfide protein